MTALRNNSAPSSESRPAGTRILARLRDLQTPLRELFGFEAFRPGQEDVVRAAVEGRDTLALMPTGSGKSLTYQLAAMLRPEPTLVLSPLIALMKDQVDKLPPAVAPTATFVNSSLPAEETASRLAEVAAGGKRLVYAAPERLRRAGVPRDAALDRRRARRRGRGALREHVGARLPARLPLHPPRARGARRADAARDDRHGDSRDRAGDQSTRSAGEPEVVSTTVVRPNLRYDVEEVANAEDRLRVLVERLRGLRGGSAIVYARSRRSTEELARVLVGHGFRAAHYHAGLEAEERTRVQDDFLGGGIQAVVATTAFGMGIDKPDVRLVCLANYPGSLEEYVQMVGRAGRDGAPSDTLLLASPSDATALRRFAISDVPSAAELRAVYRALRDSAGAVDPDELGALVPERDPRVLVGHARAGRPRPPRTSTRDGACASSCRRLQRTPPSASRRCSRGAELVAESRADRIVAFAESRGCRHAQVAEHFGEAFEPPCGACDVCAPRASRTAVSDAPPPLPDDVAEAIVEAVASLRWPLGRRSLVATLRGSLKAPPSARRSLAYRLLAAASDVRGPPLGAAPRGLGSARRGDDRRTASASCTPTRARRGRGS